VEFPARLELDLETPPNPVKRDESLENMGRETYGTAILGLRLYELRGASINPQIFLRRYG
jgi:hypothetical protein